ncbi:DUF421 domain-containing protein [Mesobacillus maritimus]|uniref:DUF421 domain-containing protein n=1 Tax=Mesobacillus maritimus TaxID=1643336 RepID=UPI00203D15B2|nr:DUF421 domain-containing protein [Mesobacillus maritimus]MCM3585528.1 DUF421 domain-containing protein [Mesobacillus maritimus]MCM3669788.1 DUF421 domain-containing protein [Mesobacillus maritimus]
MYGTILIEIIGGYLILFIIVRIQGKTQISQISPFDFVSALVLGELVGNAIYDKETGFGVIVFAIVVWGILTIVTELLTQKSRFLRYLFEGKPSIIIDKGNLDWKQMKRNRLDVDQLQQLLRDKGVFSLQEVEYAILENNGGISVLKKAAADQPTLTDLKIKTEERVIPYTIVSDGEVLSKNLQAAGVNEEWLYTAIRQKGIQTPSDISYAEYVPGKEIFIQKY